MRKNRKRQIFEKLEIIDAGAKGKAVAKAPDGRTVFVTNAVPGDVVDIQTTRKRKAYYEGTAINFHQLSDKRTEPRCEHFGVCGGCKWQHMGYQHQLFFKEKEVINNLTRIGHLELPENEPILGSEKQYEYRNKLEFSFSDSRWLTQEEINEENQIVSRNGLGFHIPGRWDKILDIKHCHLQATPSNEIRLAVKQYAEENGLAFYSPREQKGLLRNLMIRTTSTAQLMVLLQFYADSPDERNSLLNFLIEKFPEIDSLLYVINNKANDTIYDLDVHCYAGKDHIYEEMEGLKFKISAKSFYQTNSDQAYNLYKIVREYAGLKGDEIVYDLYTGTGTIALFLAGLAKKVIGIDSVPDAIKAAESNAIENNIPNSSFFAGDMKDIFNEEFTSKYDIPDVIITDPPRDGMHKNVVKQILSLAPPKVVYVSCNSATQARDLALMKDVYTIKKIQPVDMFPQTHHVENVVLLEKRV